jgi:hypothetical protein
MFAQDREELPFNRAQRSWVYRAAKNIDSTVAFGSTHPLNVPGEILFLNGLFPPLDEEVQPRSDITFGEGYARSPYRTSSFFNISAMSFGALSAPAVRALCLGADCVNSARGFMFALGCVQALQCNKNTCPTGITTHDEDLQKGLHPPSKARRVASYARNMMHEVEVIAHSCGVAEPALLNRSHAQVINDRCAPEPMTQIYSDAATSPQFVREP